MHPVELIGYLASALVFATFCVKAMTPLRLIAIASNIAFIGYGYLGQMAPILLLHVGLLPLNVWRLCQTQRSNKSQRTTNEVCLSATFLRARKMSRRRAGERTSFDRLRRMGPADRPSGCMPPADGAP
jgi:CRP/FNR family transcriptional regulator, cyclic AMP receptor protein